MNFNTIIQRLNQLTTFMNNVIANSKKIFELPEQTDGEKLVAVWNEESQRTEKYNFTELIAYINSINTRIVNFGTIDRDVNEFTFNVGFEWIIQGIEYANTSAIVETIAFAESGNNRIDIAVLNTSNNIIIVTGFETDGTAEQPLPPPNTILLKIFVVTDADITEVDPPAPTLTIIQEGGITVPNVGSITFDGATIEDLGDGNIKVTITGGGGSTPTLAEVLAVGDREINPALDSDSLIDLEAHKYLVTCESLTENATFIVPTIEDFLDAFPTYLGNSPEFKILNNSAFTITLEGDTGVTLIGDVLEIPENAVACVKYISGTDTWSVTYQTNSVGGGGGAVDSVNGQTGVVVLDAEDVGAEPTIPATTSADYYRGDKTFQPLNKSAVGLGNVDNTSDANKPVSTATQTALDLKEAKASWMRLPSDYTLPTTSTTLQKMFNVGSGGNGSLYVTSGKRYKFTIRAVINNPNGTSMNFRFGVLGTATISSLSFTASTLRNSALNIGGTATIFTGTTTSVITTTNTTTFGQILIEGDFSVSGSGTFIPSMNTSVADTINIIAGSIIEIWEFGSSSDNASSDIV